MQGTLFSSQPLEVGIYTVEGYLYSYKNEDGTALTNRLLNILYTVLAFLQHAIYCWRKSKCFKALEKSVYEH